MSDIEARHRTLEAVSLARRGKRKGLRTLEQLQLECREPEDWMRMGDAWLRLEKLERSADCFLRSAHRHLERDQAKHACAMLRMVLDIDPDHDAARDLLAESLEAQGHHQAAREVRERIGREIHQTGRRPGRRWEIPSAPHAKAIWMLRKLRKAA